MNKIKYPPCADGDPSGSSIHCMQTQGSYCKFEKNQRKCPTYRVNEADCHWEVIEAGYEATMYMLRNNTIVVIYDSKTGSQVSQVQGECKNHSGYEGGESFLEAIDLFNDYIDCQDCGAYCSNESSIKCKTCDIYKKRQKKSQNEEENMPEELMPGEEEEKLSIEEEEKLHETNKTFREEKRKELDKIRLTQGYKRFSEISNDSIFSSIRYLLPHTTTLQEMEVITDDIVSILEQIYVKELKKLEKE